MRIAEARCLPARCPSCQPTNSVKALTGGGGKAGHKKRWFEENYLEQNFVTWCRKKKKKKIIRKIEQQQNITDLVKTSTTGVKCHPREMSSEPACTPHLALLHASYLNISHIALVDPDVRFRGRNALNLLVEFPQSQRVTLVRFRSKHSTFYCTIKISKRLNSGVPWVLSSLKKYFSSSFSVPDQCEFCQFSYSKQN